MLRRRRGLAMWLARGLAAVLRTEGQSRIQRVRGLICNTCGTSRYCKGYAGVATTVPYYPPPFLGWGVVRQCKKKKMRFGKADRCPLSGVLRKSHFRAVRTVFDPTRTLALAGEPAIH